MKKIRLYLLTSIVAIWWFFSMNNIVSANTNYDLLQQAFEAARSQDYVVWKWNDPKTVWWEIFNTTWNINIDRDPTTEFWTREEPYIVRISKLIIRVAVALSVSIVIVWGIMYIVAFGDDGKQKKARRVLMYALIWLLVSLGALAIVQLATTITRNSLWSI